MKSFGGPLKMALHGHHGPLQPHAMPGRLRLRSTLRGNRLRYAAAAMLLLAQALALTFVGTQDTSASKALEIGVGAWNCQARSIMHSWELTDVGVESLRGAATMTVAVLKAGAKSIALCIV